MKFDHEESRLERLYKLLRQNDYLTLNELSRRLGVSGRHLQRLVGQLRARGVGVHERRRNRFKELFLSHGDRELEGGIELSCSDNEALALLLAAKIAQATLDPTPVGKDLANVNEQLVEAIGDRPRLFEPEFVSDYWSFESTEHSTVRPEVFSAIMQAVANSATVCIDYYTASTGKTSASRKIDPYLIALRGSSWLVTAYCHERQRILDFSMAGISKVAFTESYFSRRQDFDPEIHFRDRFRALDGDDVYVVVLEVEASKAEYFKRKEYHFTQQIEKRADGSITVSYEVMGLDEIAAFIRSWGPGVRVLEPTELARRIRDEAASVAALYDLPEIAGV